MVSIRPTRLCGEERGERREKVSRGTLEILLSGPGERYELSIGLTGET
jgi:hypothetical protein